MKTMTYEAFKAAVVARLDGDIPAPKHIEVKDVMKDNGGHREAITVFEAGTNIAPTIYPEEFYSRMVRDETVKFEDVYNDILGVYNRNKKKEDVDTDALSDFERVRGNIFPKLVNAEKNAKLLQDVPHVPFLDLAVTFIIVRPAGGDFACIRVTDAMLSLWDRDSDVPVTAETLYGIAMENARKKMPVRIQDINGVLHSLFDGCDDMPEIPEGTSAFPMLVLSNEQCLYASACMTDDAFLRECARRLRSGFYILPSSVHELILVPSDVNDRAEELNGIVQSVNAEQVPEKDFLSDHAYYYAREAGKLVCV